MNILQILDFNNRDFVFILQLDFHVLYYIFWQLFYKFIDPRILYETFERISYVISEIFLKIVAEAYGSELRKRVCHTRTIRNYIENISFFVVWL